MKRLPEALRILLGVESSLDHTDIAPAVSSLGQGFAAPTPTPPSELLLAWDGPVPRPVPVGNAPLELLRFPGRPLAFVVASELPVVALRGRVLQQDGVYLVDTSDSLTLVVGDWVLDLDHGRGAVYQLPTTPSLGAPPVPGLVPDWPGAGALLDGWQLEDWLSVLADGLGDSPVELDRIAAAGALARLWLPANPQDRRRAVRAAMSGASPVQAQIRDWLVYVQGWEGLEAALWQHVEDHTERLQRWCDSGGAGLGDELALGVLERDTLASMVAALQLAGRETHALSAALTAADHRWATLLTAIGGQCDLGPHRAHLLAVGAAEPDVWWAGLGT